VLLVLAVIVGVSGPGGFGIQNWDWTKHNAILRDLVDEPWPVVYATGKDDVVLTYYIAYYLPSAVVGKVIGWKAANVTTYLWTLLGCFLALAWLKLLSRSSWWPALATLVLFSGMDLIGDVFWRNREEPLHWLNDFDVEWWGKFWTYPSNLTLMAYAPNQAIAGWLFTALLVSALRVGQVSFPIGGLLTLSLLWSPFLTVGLLALTGLWFIGHRCQWTGWARGLLSSANLAAVPLGLVLALYFQARFLPSELPSSLCPGGIAMTGEFGFLLDRAPPSQFIPAYLLFVALEFGFLALLLCSAARGQNQADRRLLVSAVVILLALPWLHYGRHNDLVMRTCIPALYVLQIISLGLLAGPVDSDVQRRNRILQGALVIVLAVGSLYPFNMLRITAMRLKERSWKVIAIPSRQQTPDLFEQEHQLRASGHFIGQYMGSVESWFLRWLGKRHPPSAYRTTRYQEPPSANHH
jgi:hypothetical protein